jgi:hypothetical protein
MTFTKQDLKLALKEIGHGIVFFAIMAVKVATATVVGLAVLGTVVYLMAHFFLQSLAVMLIVASGTWLWVELTIARTTREYEEQQESWRAEKAKSSHPEYKETL